MLLASLAMIPVGAAIYWFVDRSKIDWKLSATIALSLSILWYLGISASTFLEFARSDVRRISFRKSFPASTFSAGIYGLSVVMATAIGIGMFREGDLLWLQFIDIAFY